MKKEIEIILLAILVGTMIGISITLGKGFKNLSRIDCSYMIPAYQHQLKAKIEKLRYAGTTQEMYNCGWEDALENILNLIK